MADAEAGEVPLMAPSSRWIVSLLRDRRWAAARFLSCEWSRGGTFLIRSEAMVSERYRFFCGRRNLKLPMRPATWFHRAPFYG